MGNTFDLNTATFVIMFITLVVTLIHFYEKK